MSIAMFGSYYAFDAIGPLAPLLTRQLRFSDSEIGVPPGIARRADIADVGGRGLRVLAMAAAHGGRIRLVVRRRHGAVLDPGFTRGSAVRPGTGTGGAHAEIRLP